MAKKSQLDCPVVYWTDTSTESWEKAAAAAVVLPSPSAPSRRGSTPDTLEIAHLETLSGLCPVKF